MKTSPFLFGMGLTVLCTCAGLRSGFESRIDGKTAESDRVSIDRMGQFQGYGRYHDDLNLPGVTLNFELNNDIHTHESLWFGIVIPMIPFGWDSKDLYWRYVDTDYMIEIEISPDTTGYVFDWGKVEMAIDDSVYCPHHGVLNIWRVLTDTLEAGETVPLSRIENTYRAYKFKLKFNAKTPKPMQKIQIDLSEALTHPGCPPIPVIHFKKKRWFYWYG